MHIIVAGDHETPVRIAEALMKDHQVSLIIHQTNLSRVDHLDVQVVRGSATSAPLLREAGAVEADFFVAASDSDELNIVSCLAASKLGTHRTICFLGAALGDHFEFEDDVALADSIIGVDEIIRPSEQLAEEIVRIVTVPGALDVRSFHGGRVLLLKDLIGADAPIIGKPLGEVGVPEGVRIAMIQRGREFLVPDPKTALSPDDRVTTMGTRVELMRFRSKALGMGRHRLKKREAIICGGGIVGFRVAQGLGQLNWRVKLIEENKDRCEELAQQLDCRILHGDGSDLDLLEQERISTADALVAVTDNDEGNLLISLLAKSLKVPRIITRADRAKNARLFEQVGIDVVLSTQGAAIRTVVGDIVQTDTKHLADLEHGTLGVFEFELPSHFPKTLLYDLGPPCLASVGAVLRGRRTLVPSGADELHPRDRILVVCRTEDAEQTGQYFLGLKALPRETA